MQRRKLGNEPGQERGEGCSGPVEAKSLLITGIEGDGQSDVSAPYGSVAVQMPTTDSEPFHAIRDVILLELIAGHLPALPRQLRPEASFHPREPALCLEVDLRPPWL